MYLVDPAGPADPADPAVAIESTLREYRYVATATVLVDLLHSREWNGPDHNQ